MKLIDWHSKDPLPSQQVRAMLARIPRAIRNHVAWALEEIAWNAEYVTENIHAALCRLRGLPDPRDRIYELTPKGREVDA